MQTGPKPLSIEIHEADQNFVHGDLDYAYIDRTAKEAADLFETYPHNSVEIAYQPGDMTLYPLVMTPLASLRATSARIVDGRVWNRHAVAGIYADFAEQQFDGAQFYGTDGYLVTLVERTAYPLALRRFGKHLAASYVHDHWGVSGVSACSLVILFRAIAYYMEANS